MIRPRLRQAIGSRGGRVRARARALVRGLKGSDATKISAIARAWYRRRRFTMLTFSEEPFRASRHAFVVAIEVQESRFAVKEQEIERMLFFLFHDAACQTHHVMAPNLSHVATPLPHLREAEARQKRVAASSKTSWFAGAGCCSVEVDARDEQPVPESEHVGAV